MVNQRLKIALQVFAAFCSNPSVFAPNGQTGWGLVNCDTQYLADLSVQMADELIRADAENRAPVAPRGLGVPVRWTRSEVEKLVAARRTKKLADLAVEYDLSVERLRQVLRSEARRMSQKEGVDMNEALRICGFSR